MRRVVILALSIGIAFPQQAGYTGAAGISGQAGMSGGIASYVPPDPPPPPTSYDEYVPASTGMLNVKTDCGAAGNGTTDDTAAIQSCIYAANASRSPTPFERIVYFPNGTYRVTNTLYWKSSGGTCRAYVAFRGQTRDGAIIKLDNSATGFNNPASPKAVLMTSSENGGTYDGVCGGDDGFFNNFYSLTVNTGTGNSGAIGIDWNSHNDSFIRNVAVTGTGLRGISAARTAPYNTILSYIANTSVTGFDTGIYVTDTCCSLTLYDVTLSGQTTRGINPGGNPIFIEDLTSTNTGPALYLPDSTSFATVINSTLSGGSVGNSAIHLVNAGATAFVRDVTTAGYGYAINDNGTTTASPVTEWSSNPVVKLFAASPSTSMRLPVEAPPWYAASSTASDWANVTAYGAVANDLGDDRAGIQAAIDSGKPVVYLPLGKYRVSGPIYVRGAVRKIKGFAAHLTPYNTTWLGPLLEVTTPDGADVTIESIRGSINWDVGGDPRPTVGVQAHTTKQVILRDVAGDFNLQTTSGQTGKVWVDGGSIAVNIGAVHSTWLRYLNPEGPWIVNNGGTLWLMGGKTEGSNTDYPIINTNGGRTEVLGFLISRSRQSTGTIGMRAVNTGSGIGMWATFATYYSTGPDFVTCVQETRNSVTLSKPCYELPSRGSFRSVASFSGY